MKSSNFFVVLIALPLALPLLAMEQHVKRGTIDGYLATRPTAPLLIRAAVAGDAQQVAVLLDAGADVDAEDTSQHTSLTCAAALGYEEICKILIAHGANVNHLYNYTQFNCGQTPLMAAAEQQENDICTLLIKSNADVFKQNIGGWSALNYAQNQNAHDTCKLLIDAMLKPTKEDKESAYTLLAILNKKYPSAKDTNKLIVIDLLHKYMQLKKPMILDEIKKVNRPPELIDYVNRK